MATRATRTITSLKGAYEYWGLKGAPFKFQDRKLFCCPTAMKMTRDLMKNESISKGAGADFFLGANRLLRQLAAGVDHRQSGDMARLFASVGHVSDYNPTTMVNREALDGHLIGFVNLRLRSEKCSVEGVWTMKADGPRMVYVCRRDESAGSSALDYYAEHGEGVKRALRCAEGFFGTFQHGRQSR